MSYVVLLFFFGLLTYMFLTDTQGRFLALVMGTVLFPTTALLIKNPSVSPQHIFLYAFFIIEFFKDRQNFNKSIFNNLLLFPIGLSLVSYIYAMSSTDSVTFMPHSSAAAKRTFMNLQRNLFPLPLSSALSVFSKFS